MLKFAECDSEKPNVKNDKFMTSPIHRELLQRS